ncbi:hypothetical protein [Burkholderia gladioli]|uniref:hypothetical protein n=1 Tax=Burkholderia gladioli TaxID=28095 RepID=UPI0038B26F76
MRQADYARQFDESTQRRAGRRQAARRVTIVIGNEGDGGTIGTDRREPGRGTRAPRKACARRPGIKSR